MQHWFLLWCRRGGEDTMPRLGYCQSVELRRMGVISEVFMKIRLCLLLLLSITGATLTYAQGNKKPRTISDYQPRTLQELANLLPEPFRIALAERGVEGNKNLKQIVHGEMFPSRVKAVYSG